jgi:hypothetical protein
MRAMKFSVREAANRLRALFRKEPLDTELDAELASRF